MTLHFNSREMKPKGQQSPERITAAKRAFAGFVRGNLEEQRGGPPADDDDDFDSPPPRNRAAASKAVSASTSAFDAPQDSNQRQVSSAAQ